MATFDDILKIAEKYGYKKITNEALRDYNINGNNELLRKGENWRIDFLESIVYNTESGEKFDLE